MKIHNLDSRLSLSGSEPNFLGWELLERHEVCLGFRVHGCQPGVATMAKKIPTPGARRVVPNTTASKVMIISKEERLNCCTTCCSDGDAPGDSLVAETSASVLAPQSQQ